MYRPPDTDREWRRLAVRLLTTGGLLVFAVVLGFVLLGLSLPEVEGGDRGTLLILLLMGATVLSAIAAYGAYYRRPTLIWGPGILLLILAVPWASFWPFVLGAAMIGLAGALARPERRAEEEGDEGSSR